MNNQKVSRVLVADDDSDIRTFLALTLEDGGYEVSLAGDGAEAMRAARQTQPQLIVLDVMMPGVDGISALRSLKADPRTNQIPIVLLTAKTADHDVWAGWQAGADYYMTKPFDLDDLMRFIDHLGDPEGEHLRVR